MEKDRIQKAAQLADDLKKVNNAMGLYDNHEKVAVRLSVNLDDQSLFAYLPKSIAPAIYQVLVEAKEYILKEMEDL